MLQTTQPTSVGVVTPVLASSSANCVETSRPQQWRADLPFFGKSHRPCGPVGWLALFLIKSGDVETNTGPTTTHKQVWICDICHKQIHGRKQISIRCNRIAPKVLDEIIYRFQRSRTTRGGTITQQTTPANRDHLYPDSLLFGSARFLPRVSSQRLN